MNKFQETKNQKILIDSCILIYCGSDLGQEFKKILRKLTDNNNTLAISEFSGFEVLKKIKNEKIKNETTENYYLKLLNFLHNIQINRDILIEAARLFSKYNKKSPQDEQREKRLAGDLIIGATAINNNALLLTVNQRDFPTPFWEIIDRDYILFDKEQKTQVLNVYLLKPEK